MCPSLHFVASERFLNLLGFTVDWIGLVMNHCSISCPNNILLGRAFGSIALIGGSQEF